MPGSHAYYLANRSVRGLQMRGCGTVPSPVRKTLGRGLVVLGWIQAAVAMVMVSLPPSLSLSLSLSPSLSLSLGLRSTGAAVRYPGDARLWCLEDIRVVRLDVRPFLRQPVAELGRQSHGADLLLPVDGSVPPGHDNTTSPTPHHGTIVPHHAQPREGRWSAAALERYA